MIMENGQTLRARYWFWARLLTWSGLTAAAVVVLESWSNFLDDSVGTGMMLAQLGVEFTLCFFLILGTAGMGILIWHNLPRSGKSWFRVGVVSVLLGLLASAGQIWGDMYSGNAHTTAQAFGLLLSWTCFFLVLLLFLRACVKSLRHWLDWHKLKRGLFALGVFGVIIVLFYAEENWRGRRAWQNFSHEWEQRGEKFELAALAPPPVPDEQNFALAPVMVNNPELSLTLVRTNLYLNTNTVIGSWVIAKPTNLKPWQDYYRTMVVTNIEVSSQGKTQVDVVPLAAGEFPMAAQSQSPAKDVVLALSRYDVLVEQLRQAGRRPASRFLVNYLTKDRNGRPERHLGVLASTAEVLQLRAIAELQSGRTEQALADIQLMFRLAESLRTEPLSYPLGVRCLIVERAIQAIWEGLALHCWSDAQLTSLIQDLRKVDLLPSFAACLRGDLADGLGGIEYGRTHRLRDDFTMGYVVWPTVFDFFDHFPKFLPDLPRPASAIWDSAADSISLRTLAGYLGLLIPDGWYEQNKVCLAKTCEEHLIPLVRPGVSAREWVVTESRLSIRADQINPRNLLALTFLPSVHTFGRQFYRMNTAINLAAVACAGERYHLAHHEYPDALDALAPQFIDQVPPDVIDGQPLHYRRTREGSFILYSIGWNIQDDGGMVATNKAGVFDVNNGDWVWQYPAK